MSDKRREQALAVYCEHNTGNADANYYEMRDSAVASMLAFAAEEPAKKDDEIARLREDAERYRWLRESEYGQPRTRLMQYLQDIHLDKAIDAARKETK